MCHKAYLRFSRARPRQWLAVLRTWDVWVFTSEMEAASYVQSRIRHNILAFDEYAILCNLCHPIASEMKRCVRVSIQLRLEFHGSESLTAWFSHWMRASTAIKKFFVILTRRRLQGPSFYDSHFHRIVIRRENQFFHSVARGRAKLSYKLQIW